MKKNIFICEDDEDISEATSMVLLDQGFETCLIKEEKELQDMLRKRKPDLILLDLFMPGINAREDIKRLKKDVSTQDIPIIIFSANDQIKKISDEVGADGYLMKPFDIADLVSIVKKFSQN